MIEIPQIWCQKGTSIKKILKPYRQYPTITILKKTFPEHTFHPWMFPSNSFPLRFWSHQNCRSFFWWLACELCWRQPIHFYTDMSNSLILKYANRVLLNAIKKNHEHLIDWVSWELGESALKPWEILNLLPIGYFTSQSHISTYFDFILEKMKLYCPEEMYNLEKRVWDAHFFHFVIRNQFNESFVKCILWRFPELSWKLWLFSNAPQGFWKEKKNHSDVVVWLGEERGFSHPSQYTNLEKRETPKKIAKLLRHQYSNSLPLFISTHLGEKWRIKPLKYERKDKDTFWDNPSSHVSFAYSLAKKHKFNIPKKWYSIHHRHFEHRRFLTKYYKDSVYTFVLSLFPQFEWIMWHFNIVPPNFWTKKQHHKNYFSWLTQKFTYPKYSDTKKTGDGLISIYYNTSFPQFLQTFGNTEKGDILLQHASTLLPSHRIKQKIV